MTDSSDGRPFARMLANLDLPRVPQQARSRQKRDALMAAAAELFAARGYEANTADDIAAAAGVSVGTFYSYFRNKRQIFLALYAQCIESIDALNIAAIDLGGGPRAAIRDVIRRASERDQLFYGLQRALAELLPHDPELAASDAQFNEQIRSQIVAVIERAAAAGLTWPALDIEETAWLIGQLLDQVWRIDPHAGKAGPAQPERRHTALADLIYHTVFKS
jgi:AcrR family transcriptional regulator